MRDDFDSHTKDVLAKRVGTRCSNPNCRKLTAGPQEDPEKALNIGVAAHITAASPGGPRYNESITGKTRGSIENGIWLCQNCAKLIDNDTARYTCDMLFEWKVLSERAALLELEYHADDTGSESQDDMELVRFFSQCFDRPAFQDRFHQETSMEAFDKAIEDTITAINTGCLRSHEGNVLFQARGKSFLSNPDWRRRMDVVVDLLRAIRSRFALATRTGEIRVGPEHAGRHFYLVKNRGVAAWMDRTRAEVIRLVSSVCQEAGVPPLRFPIDLDGPLWW